MKRKNVMLGIVATVAVMLAYAPTYVLAQRMDRVETRRDVRRLNERTDDMQDRLEGWIEEKGHHDERTRQAVELNHHIDDFITALLNLRLSVIQHDHPEDAHDQAKALLDAGHDLHHAVEKASYLPPEVTADWKQMHDVLNQLAAKYQLEPIR